MNLAISTRCIECNFRKNLALARSHGDEETAMAFTRELMQYYLQLPPEASSGWFAPGTNELFRKYYGLDPDDMTQEKRESNEFVLARLDSIRTRVRSAPDPVKAGIQFSILGNYLDFSALRGQVDFSKLDGMMEKALEMALDEECYVNLLRELQNAKSLLYLTDNAGEIGFDRVLAEVLREKYPHLEITFCVRGGPVHNDATREDAALMGIPFPVIDNGNDLCGTILSRLSGEAKAAMDSADVIFAKGMGNTESLYGSGYPIYYAFLVKCDHFAHFFDKPLMTPLLVREPFRG